MPDNSRPPVEPGTTSEAWPVSGVGARATQAPAPEAPARRGLASVGFMLDALRRRRGGRIALWSIVAALALTGVGLLAYPFATDVWASRIQSQLEDDYRQISADDQIDTAAELPRKNGSPLTKLTIPRLGVRNLIVVEGVTGNALRAGAGHYPTSALPGDPTGNVAIAGHRTGFGQPFRHMDRLRMGDKIILETPVGRYTYEVMPPFDGHENPWITHARDWTVVSQTPEPSLTLTTCDPPGTSLNRMIVRARLVRTATSA